MAEQALRVALLTRTGRRSGQAIATGIAAGRHELCGILAEKRSSLLRGALRRDSLLGVLKRYGLGFFAARAARALRREGGGARLAGDGRAKPPAATVVDRLNSDAALRLLESWRPDVLVVANAPILTPEVFGCCRLGGINFHSGRLPEYGGVESEFWALYNAEPETWVTVHRITTDLDAGDVLAERAVPISDSDTPESLHDTCIELGVRLIGDVLDVLASGAAPVVRRPGPAVLRPWPSTRQRLQLVRRLRTRRRQATKR